MKHYSRIVAGLLSAIMLISSAGYCAVADNETAGAVSTEQTVSAADPENVEEYLKVREQNTVFSKFTYTEYIAQYTDVPDASETITFGSADPAYITASVGDV